MNVRRGDIIWADFPYATGRQSKQRPILIVQADYYNRRVHNAVAALLTSNLRNATDPAHLLIEASSPEGRQAGLTTDSVVSCINLVTVSVDRLIRKIGELSDAAMQQIEKCLKAALEIA